jgi:hypothetical protein
MTPAILFNLIIQFLLQFYLKQKLYDLAIAQGIKRFCD